MYIQQYLENTNFKANYNKIIVELKFYNVADPNKLTYQRSVELLAANLKTEYFNLANVIKLDLNYATKILYGARFEVVTNSADSIEMIIIKLDYCNG